MKKGNLRPARHILAAVLIGVSAMASVPIREEIKPGGVSMAPGHEPALTVWTGDNTSLDLYYLGEDGTLWTSWDCNGQWVSHDNLGTMGPVKNSGSRVGSMSASGNAWEFTFWNGEYPDWTLNFECYDPGYGFYYGGVFAYDVNPCDMALANWDGFGMDVFYRKGTTSPGNSTSMYDYYGDGVTHRVFEYGSGQWTGEDVLGHVPFTLSSAVYVPGVTYVFGVNKETRHLWYFPYWGQTGVGSISPVDTGWTIPGQWEPALVWANQKFHGFWVDGSQNLIHQDFTTGRQENLGSGYWLRPAVATRGDNRIDIVAGNRAGIFTHLVYIDDGM